jgi:nucleotide-binding universal stress UspA family protein
MTCVLGASSATHLPVKEANMTECQNILFCTDFSEDATAAFVHALELARKSDAKLHILHIPHSPYFYCKHIVDEHVPDGKPGGESFFNEEVEKKARDALAQAYGKQLRDYPNHVYVVKSGSPSIEICRYAKKNQVKKIIMGSFGKWERDRKMYGGTREKVTRFSPCDVVAIHSGADRGPLPPPREAPFAPAVN